MADTHLHVAIVGGGLCGLALAIALERRQVSYTIYEMQSSFSEIGLGLNVAPNGIAAFNLIEPGLGDEVMALSIRNSPNPDTWMVQRLGVPKENRPDASVIAEILAPDVGHTAVGRYELLDLLASKIDVRNARFNKRLNKIDENDDNVMLSFEDGTTDVADAVIGCDGVHSAARKSLLGAEHPALAAKSAERGVYRSVFPMDRLTEALGSAITGTSCIWSGPGGCVIMYAIEGGRKVNVGFWTYDKQSSKQDPTDRWVLDNQRAAMLEDFKDWGPTMKEVMSMTSETMQYWISHQHSPIDNYHDGRICVIGDAAHAMGPHLGQGASQAMEDAYVMAKVLSEVGQAEFCDTPISQRIDAAFRGWQDVRKPQFEWITRASHAAFDRWESLWHGSLSDPEVMETEKHTQAMLSRVWDSNIERQGEVAKSVMMTSLNCFP